MTTTRWFVVVALAIGLTPADVAARQDALVRARDYYASASYEDALQVITQLRSRAAGPVPSELAAYQVYCLLALGRQDEAAAATEAIVRADPLYRPGSDASPRVREFFEQVRLPLLPVVVRDLYAGAKASLQDKQPDRAVRGFEQVIAILDELGTADNPSAADMRTLAVGFRDLSAASVVSPEPAQPATTAERATPTEAAPEMAPPRRERAAYGRQDRDVQPPAIVSRPLPEWRPRTPVERLQGAKGAVELLVDERGNVVSATLFDRLSPEYDHALLRAAQFWRFTPATRDGRPVKYKYLMEITLDPTGP
jgi:hypothetical protein